MERRTLLLCVNHFLKKLTVSHQDVSVLVNFYYKRRASLPSSSQCITKNLCLPRPCISVETNYNSLRSDISRQFETLQNKVSSQKEMLTDLKEKVQKVSVLILGEDHFNGLEPLFLFCFFNFIFQNGEDRAVLASNLEYIKNSLQHLREDQDRKQGMVEEALKLLNVLVEKHSVKAAVVRASAAQTSPEFGRPVCNSLPENKLNSTQLKLVSHKLGLPQYPSQIIGRKTPSLRGHRSVKRPLVLSQRSKCSIADLNCPPTCVKQQKVCKPSRVPQQDSLGPDLKVKSSDKKGGNISLLIPHNCWSQSSNNSLCLPEVDPIPVSGKLSSESTTGTPTKREGLWQMFGMDSDTLLGF